MTIQTYSTEHDEKGKRDMPGRRARHHASEVLSVVGMLLLTGSAVLTMLEIGGLWTLGYATLGGVSLVTVMSADY